MGTPRGPGDEPEAGLDGPAEARRPPPDDARAVEESKTKQDLEREGAEKAAAELNELRAKNAKLLAEVDELKSLAASSTGAPKDLQHLHLLQIQPVRDILVL